MNVKIRCKLLTLELLWTGYRVLHDLVFVSFFQLILWLYHTSCQNVLQYFSDTECFSWLCMFAYSILFIYAMSFFFNFTSWFLCYCSESFSLILFVYEMIGYLLLCHFGYTFLKIYDMPRIMSDPWENF
jgi:hypothetical protein